MLGVMITPYEFLRLALDPIRLAVLGRAAEGQLDVGKLAWQLGVRERKVLQAVGRLREAGLLDDDLTLDRSALVELAGALPTEEAASAEILGEGWSSGEAQVLSRFFRGTTITQIPSQRSKRLVVLERLSQEFEPGLRYEEWQVNTILRGFHPDHAALRRLLVDEGFLARSSGVYWRTGGRVQTEAVVEG